MRSISDTIERLGKLRSAHGSSPLFDDRLTDLGPFGSNRGALEAKIHIPKGLMPRAPLVVVLHGCTQTASAYDNGSGWSRLADDYGFAVLFPQQTRSNNANMCFNWFEPGDIRGDQGEAFSICQMIETVTARYDIDRSRVFITGLSAGGAMANVMLATHPELFAGGAIIAGLPYATATTVPEAFDRMRGHGLPGTDGLQALLRSASRHDGPWPAISVWQGTKDHTVVPANAVAIIEQWRGVHEVEHQPATEGIDRHQKIVWRGKDGREALELYQLGGMGHGTPIDASSGYGTAGPYMLDAGISSTQHIARSWGLIASFEKRVNLDSGKSYEQPASTFQSPYPSGKGGIQQTIEKALRAAGLMK
ncbi:extracellular catalytic domain type 1 short-chain-length polyhydroxyalkanoate depolymerase [Rhizobium herbae]|uniref:Poly(Hydroxyalkanoate) depolymerase family esterase n=1 Tax=Rhizobium herbae TaxID=508661 RepID=A0ABS4ER34_9HYPH|nr:PHB depolymerase family esterase [Rhizobium herbae]MBP1860402.1 poly(hydroxyalkanoate) depolymerase family esterase [Rhizobium herbae]